MLVEELERTETEEGRPEAGKIKVVDCATKFKKLYGDNKQHNSTFTLRTCHCAECGTAQNSKDNYLHSKAIPS